MAGDQLLDDDRFTAVVKDPKFKKGHKHRRKIKIDERFRSMFENDAFKVRYHVDKRGRNVSGTSTEDLKRFYSLSSDDDDEEETGKEHLDDAQEFPALTREEEDALRKKQITSNIRKKLKDLSVDYARGEGVLGPESSSDESETDSDEEALYHEWNELDKDADTTEEATNRLAVCNMDWDRIKAVDLMMLFNSFLPPKANIHSVVIYPSEFGLKRMAEEDIRGPAELVSTEAKCESDSDDEDIDDTEEGKRFHIERMRQYQLNRLKYYYAVVTFDTSQTADYIYTNCNGIEYESSGIRLDLRFVDDETTFDQEPKDICDNLENCRKYNPTYFTNTALQQAKVDLTWDETDPKRLEFAQKIAEAAKMNDIGDSDLENYVALSSSDDDNDEEEVHEFVDEEENVDGISASESEKDEDEVDSICKFRNMLKEIEENEKEEKSDADQSDGELEITWGMDDTGSTAKKTIISKKSNKEDKDRTPFEQLLQRRKEIKRMKKKAKSGQRKQEDVIENTKSLVEIEEKQKEELKLLLDDDDTRHHFSLEKIKRNDKKSKNKFKKRKPKDAPVDDFQVDVNDDRFEALYSSHLFNIDPTNPKFTKTNGMNAFVTEKQKRIAAKITEVAQNDEEPQFKKKKVDAELNTLVKSVKNKTKYFLKERPKRQSVR